MTIVCIHQPDFAPWLGFFDRLAKCDTYVVLDTVQFLRRGWHHRDLIKTPQGAQWITVPVHKKGRYHQAIRDVEIDYSSDWRDQHLKTLLANYKRAPHFSVIFPLIEDIYKKKYPLLIDLNMSIIHLVMDLFDIQTKIVLASDLNAAGAKTDFLVNAVSALGGTGYLTGEGSRDYLQEDAFESIGIQVNWQQFEHPMYQQLFDSFISRLSVFDYLFNCGTKSDIFHNSDE